MAMAIQINQCPMCGGPVNQEGADKDNVYYRCMACGHLSSVANEGTNNECIMQKRELLGRLREGLVDWQATRWDVLHRDIHDFLNRYETEQGDIQLQMGIIACITRGFNTLDDQRYKQCKNLYKITEKMYKSYEKELKAQYNAELNEKVDGYKTSRKKYLHCRNQYRNTKLMWKAVFFVLKKLVPFK